MKYETIIQLDEVDIDVVCEWNPEDNEDRASNHKYIRLRNRRTKRI